jgi:chromosomal replication initiator protein
MRGEPVTGELVDELLDSLHPHTAGRATEHHSPRVPITRIQAAVAEHFDLSLEELLGKDRSKRVAGPRQIAMFLACELSGETLPMIAAAFDRDHSTVIHAREKVGSTHRTDPAAAAAVDSLRTAIHGTSAGVDGAN